MQLSYRFNGSITTVTPFCSAVSASLQTDSTPHFQSSAVSLPMEKDFPTAEGTTIK
jgi:hypothetical protein